MAVTYIKVLSEVAAALNAINATTTATMDTAYSGTLANADLVVDYPVTLLQDTILDVEAQIVQAICQTPNHPERRSFISSATGVTTGSQIAATNGASVRYLGLWGNVKDTSSGVPLTDLAATLGEEGAVEKIRQFNLHSAGIYSGLAVYWYALCGSTLHHTRSTVDVEIPAFDIAAFSGNLRVADYHRPALVSGSVARLLKDDLFPSEKRWHSEVFAAHVAAITQNRTDRQETAAVAPSAS